MRRAEERCIKLLMQLLAAGWMLSSQCSNSQHNSCCRAWNCFDCGTEQKYSTSRCLRQSRKVGENKICWCLHHRQDFGNYGLRQGPPLPCDNFKTIAKEESPLRGLVLNPYITCGLERGPSGGQGKESLTVCPSHLHLQYRLLLRSLCCCCPFAKPKTC